MTIGLDEKRVGQELRKTQQPLTEGLERLAAQVAREKGVEVAPLLKILEKLGDAGVKDEDIPTRLGEKADELIKLRAENEQLRRGPPALAAIAEEVQALIDKGEFDDARRALTRGREASRALRIDASRYEAAFLAQEARVDALQLAYRTAAVKYAEAAALVAPFDTEQQWGLLFDQAGELFKQGDEFGDNAALAEAIDIYRRCLALVPRSERPVDWAATHGSLGNALQALGGRESGTARLDGGRRRLSRSLAGIYPRARTARMGQDPDESRRCARKARRAGEREGEARRGRRRLSRSLAGIYPRARAARMGQDPDESRRCSRKARRAGEREGEARRGRRRLSRSLAGKYPRAPLQWAISQNNLGNALRVLGERESGTTRLEEAVAAYREALQENTRARVPLEWARTQNNLGNALRVLGDRESGTARLEAAVSAYREALKERTRERVPLYWAMTQNNLGGALARLGEREAGTARLEEAVSASWASMLVHA